MLLSFVNDRQLLTKKKKLIKCYTEHIFPAYLTDQIGMVKIVLISQTKAVMAVFCKVKKKLEIN